LFLFEDGRVAGDTDVDPTAVHSMNPIDDVALRLKEIRPVCVDPHPAIHDPELRVPTMVPAVARSVESAIASAVESTPTVTSAVFFTTTRPAISIARSPVHGTIVLTTVVLTAFADRGTTLVAALVTGVAAALASLRGLRG
jgi:hypothetical protein